MDAFVYEEGREAFAPNEWPFEHRNKGPGKPHKGPITTITALLHKNKAR